MKPVHPREGTADVVLKGPPGVGDLPAQFVDGPGLRSEWELTFDERQAILDGARVVLWTIATRHPPVAIEVEGVNYLGEDKEVQP
jgi:hypothetical protein